MAHSVAELRQSDYLYLMKLFDGRLIGASTEFEYGTVDIIGATKCGDTRSFDPAGQTDVKWFGLSGDVTNGWTPATLEEIKAHGLERCVIGWKSTMKPSEAVHAIDD
jgi:hypothetical protein